MAGGQQDARSVGPDDYQLIGSPGSPFTMKLLAAFKFTEPELPYVFRYRSVLSAPKLKQRSGTAQVPILITPENWYIADSTPILHLLDSRLPQPLFYPPGATGAVLAVIEEYLDEWIPRVDLLYRWGNDESLHSATAWFQQNERNSPEFKKAKPAVQKAIMERMSQVGQWGKRTLRALGIDSPKQQKEGTAEILRIFGAFEKHLETNKYVLGDIPCVIDTIIFGHLSSMLLQDPVPRRLLAHLTKVIDWVHQIENGNVPKIDLLGKLHEQLDFDNLPHFIDFMLKEISGPFSLYTQGASKAVQEGKKSFVIQVYGEEQSYRVLPYVHHSRKQLMHFLKTSLAMDPQQRDLFDNVMKKYGLFDAFGVQKSKL